MAVAPPPTYHSHLDPGDLRLRLTSRSSYGRQYQSTADPTYNHKDKSGDHVTRSGSCYRRDSSVEDSTNSSPAQGAEAEILRRSIHRKKKPEFRTRGRDSWKVTPRYRYPEQSPPREESGYPLSEAIEKAKLPPNFRMPQCDLYDGTGDPGEHVYQFQTNMLLLQVLDAVMCRAFPTTLRKAAHAWFKSLQPSILHSSEAFDPQFAFSVNKSPPGNMKALLEKANKYIQAEEYLETHRDRRGEGKPEQKKRSREITPPEGKSAKRPKHDERRPKDTFNMTPLNAKPSQILHEIKDNKALQWPDRMKSRPNKRNKDLWCHFHNDHDHTTDNCGSLKRAIEALIKRGQLRKFVAPGDGRQQTPPAMEERENQEENAGTINTISGGIAAGGSSGKAGKQYAREVCVTSPPPNKKLKTVPAATITFFDDDLKGIKIPHDDPLVITIKAGNFDVKRVLIDNGSSAEILFHDAFEKMNIPTDRLRKMDTPLYGFSNHPVTAEGIIALPVAIGTPPAQANFMLDFVVVKVPSAYNAILGRPALNRLQAVVSTYHLKMKFPTEHGIGEVKGDQTTARQCYVTSCRSKNKEALIIEDLREDTKMQIGEPVEDLVSIEKSFEELKTHLSSPPLLSKPFPGEDLLIYLSVTEVAVNTVLIREEDRVQKPIYYVSKVLQDVETRYPKIDKISLALIISARRLRPYFQSHTIVVLTDQPLRKVLMSPEASGRLVNWSVELGEFDLQYKPRTAVKAQALADFIVECTLPEDPPQLVISEVTDPWNLYVDGSLAVGNSGARIILISPEGFTIEYALRFRLEASNNEAEYEALLAGIRLAHALKVDSLSVHSDSQLVVNHVLGDYEARDERMAQYLDLVKTSAVKFQNFTIRQIPRDQNTQADTLSRLAFAEEIEARHPVYLEFLNDRSISSRDEIESIDQEPCWMDRIIKYLSTGELPSERHEARNLRVKTARYALVEGILYKKSFSLPYLRCLRPSESLYALQEVHEGICGQHLGGRTLVPKILRQGYY
ncbi:hypothetical protein RJ639_036578 [Escallonia herrerae]|uniref:RNase H type-1 domain-containing protein n=1 Tax=Escallonia herrerae TaxID=1293975 RepID=A0AA88WWX0_9ASTE|nr:hypothetical protein RJ639_036578 [Escallonia herrerae]